MARRTRKSQTSDTNASEGVEDAQTEDTGADSPINSQIEATLEALNRQVIENPDGVARAGLELATAQSLSMAVQDAVDHLRRMQMLAEASVAKSTMPTADKDDHAAVSPALDAVQAAMATLEKATALANSMARS